MVEVFTIHIIVFFIATKNIMRNLSKSHDLSLYTLIYLDSMIYPYILTHLSESHDLLYILTHLDSMIYPYIHSLIYLNRMIYPYIHSLIYLNRMIYPYIHSFN